jgi:hypothetical protein
MSKNWNKGEEITAEGLNDQGLKVAAQDPADMTLHVFPGVAIVDGTIVKYAGGDTGTFVAPVSDDRIDIVSIDAAGDINITQGSEDPSPVAPAYPADETVLCEVYLRPGCTEILNEDDSSEAYIYLDSRPLGAGSSLIDETTGATDAGKGVKTDADGLIDDSFMFDGFGDGSDGDATLNGSTDYSSWSSRSGDIYTMTRDVYLNNLTINSGKTLRPAGYRIYVLGTLENNGTIQYNGGNGGAGTNDARSPAGVGGTVVSGFFKASPGGTGGLGATSGNDGQPGGVAAQIRAGLGGRGGNGGQGGGRSSSPPTPNPSTALAVLPPVMRFGTIRFLTIIGCDYNLKNYSEIPQTQTTGAASAGTAHTHQYDSDRALLIPVSGGLGGCGGGGGHGYMDSGSAVGTSGGGGGGGGGVIFIACKTWAGNGVIEAKGGNGGQGGSATSSNNRGGSGGSGGGGGGVIIMIFAFKTYTGSTSVAGGTKGAKGTQTGSGTAPTDGTDGSAGTVYEIQMNKRLV